MIGISMPNQTFCKYELPWVDGPDLVNTTGQENPLQSKQGFSGTDTDIRVVLTK